jgi:large repetitive protein
MDSGADTVIFDSSRYFVNGIVKVPASVSRIIGSYTDFISGPDLQGMKNDGFLTISEDSTTPLWIEDFFVWEKFFGHMRFINHASRRTLILSDIHTQTAAQYFNTIEGGTVFIENCASTIGGEPYRSIPCFHFKGQNVWARQLNAERSLTEVINDGGTLWVLGFKTEDEGTAFETINNGRTEVFGGILNVGKNSKKPAFLVQDSQASIVACSIGYTRDQIFPVIAEEINNCCNRKLHSNAMPIRYLSQYFIPLFSSGNPQFFQEKKS